jgi:hypothetical protein
MSPISMLDIRLLSITYTGLSTLVEREIERRTP